ncbi:GOLPH3/VPS74 family protein [Aquihabitans sp. McL0605]|uniref:GOLPH3/VPS74 family protein n=1 Tax=Aquihabitans sp. McL0605 TaxID=3415671 RepID=UPI003CEBF089
MLIAEAFVLLALAPNGAPARGAANQPAAEVGVTGALIAELVLDGHVTLEGGRIGLTGTAPDHPLLRQALQNVGLRKGRKLKSQLASIRHSGWSEVVDGMVAAGVVGRQRPGRLGPTRHPVLDLAAQDAVLGAVRAAAASDGPIEPRTATLLALSGPCQLLEVVAPDRSARKHAKQRIDHATDQIPTARAVQSVVDAARSTIEAAASVAVIA